MNILHAVLRVYEGGDPPAAFEAMADSLASLVPLHCALWVGADGNSLLSACPRDVEVPPELLGIAAHAIRPEAFPLGSLMPTAEEHYPNAEILLLPLPDADPPTGSLVLIAEDGTFGEDIQAWEQLGSALGRVAQQQQMLRQAKEEGEALRQRAEEIEALNVLGLAANRTLDPDEVLALVARFTRTLLGAHYVTVNTTGEGQTRVRASIGLRSGDPHSANDPFASRVIEAGKPLSVGAVGGALDIGSLPLHSAEGMQVGLGVPLSLYGQTFGALVIGYRRLYQLTSRDTRLALTLAGHAAVAISNAQLHEAVEDRSRELEEAYEQLRQLTEAKERFYNAISHDLRTPIGAVKGYSELILEGVAGEIPPKARQYLESSRRAAETLLALVNDLLDFAKLEAGKVELDIRPCTLAEIVEDTLSAVRPQAEAKGLCLTVPPLDEFPPLHTDAKRVRQILVNLFSNAVKFTPDGEIALDVLHVDGTGPGADGGGQHPPDTVSGTHLEIRVSDTGPGIAREDLERVFQEFEQVAGSEGTGLGLPISRKLARLLGGDLAAESEVGVGSTFVLRLPGGVGAGVGAGAVSLADAV